MIEFEINGIKYTEIKREAYIPKNRAFVAALMIAQAFNSLDPKMQSSKEEPNYHNETLIKEYELIQNKKSQLSRSQRDYIVWQFERTFKKVENQ